MLPLKHHSHHSMAIKIIKRSKRPVIIFVWYYFKDGQKDLFNWPNNVTRFGFLYNWLIILIIALLVRNVLFHNSYNFHWDFLSNFNLGFFELLIFFSLRCRWCSGSTGGLTKREGYSSMSPRGVKGERYHHHYHHHHITIIIISMGVKNFLIEYLKDIRISKCPHLR